MRQTMQQTNKQTTYQVILFIGVIIAAFNLRPAITSVGPLLGLIRDDIGFPNWGIAFLTSMPLIAFAIMSPLAPKLAHRTSNEFALVTGLFILMIGVSLRSISIVFFLFTGTLLIGFGIAVINVLLPGVIKGNFPTKVAIMTSLYTTSMSLFATVGSAVSIPGAEGAKLGWQIALLIWIIPAILGFLLWGIIVKKKGIKQNGPSFLQEEKRRPKIWQDGFAWMIALFMGFQSALFYIMISWLPEMLINQGMSAVNAGFMLSLFQVVGIPVSFMMPMIAMRFVNQSKIVLIVNAIFVLGVIGFLIETNLAFTMIAVLLAGIGSSANFALSLLFLSIRAQNAEAASQLSGMAQSIGYIIAAFGPIVIGYIFDLTNNWNDALYLVLFILLIVSFFGFKAGKNKYVLGGKDRICRIFNLFY
ncbi:MAG TPA: MFS transporter [Pseudogracilibacillus sp.]|nr:MFS transporter [Pseudogracilibacillus sp.]